MTVSRRTRFEILRRDSHTCRYCGAAAPEVQLTVDHVIPQALGGGDEPNNLVTACRDCNAGKSSIAPDQAIVDDVDATALLFGQAMQRALEQRRAQLAALEQQIDHFEHAIWDNWTNKDGVLPLDSNWRESIERFLVAGLTLPDLDRMVRIAMNNRRVRADETFRYFCGCCWREITDLQETARRLIEDGQV